VQVAIVPDDGLYGEDCARGDFTWSQYLNLQGIQEDPGGDDELVIRAGGCSWKKRRKKAGTDSYYEGKPLPPANLARLP
jgi:hypothetical protein